MFVIIFIAHRTVEELVEELAGCTYLKLDFPPPPRLEPRRCLLLLLLLFWGNGSSLDWFAEIPSHNHLFGLRFRFEKVSIRQFGSRAGVCPLAKVIFHPDFC